MSKRFSKKPLNAIPLNSPAYPPSDDYRELTFRIVRMAQIYGEETTAPFVSRLENFFEFARPFDSIAALERKIDGLNR
jgi:hypothetical protein